MKKASLKPLIAALEVKKAAREAVRQEYRDKEKAKKLTTDERLTRLERLLGLDK